MSNQSILITGGCGFIGSHLVEYVLKHTDWDIIIIDKMTYAANKEFAVVIATNPRVTLLTSYSLIMFEPDYIAHLGAETHVDRSISDPLTFVNSNILGTFEMLEYARQLPNLKKFLYASTDEIFGDAQEQPFHEWSRYNSRNPYAATKAAAEELALAWQNTYNLPIVISHCSNVFGERQCAEKFIPLLVNEISKNEIVDIHTDQQGVSGDRTWVYVGDVVKAIMAMLLQGKPRTKFNIPGKKLSNLEVASEVARVLDKSLRYRQVYPYHRPGWDFSYNVTGTELSALGWELSNDTSFWDEFRKTVRSYEHSEAYI